MIRPLTASLLLASISACNGSSGGDTGTGVTEASTAETTGSSGPATTAPTASTTAPTTGTGETTDEPTTSTTGDASTTGEPAFCHGWQTAEGAPYLELYDNSEGLLVDGATLPIECGGQGLFMFGLYARFGGFVPPGEIIDFAVTVDVEGFNDNPDGHFYSADPVGYYLGCEPVVGGVLGVIPVFPLDNLEDLTALDGKPAAVHVVMPTGDGEFVLDLDLVLSVKKDDSWGFCGG